MKKLNQSAFTIIEATLIIVIVGIIAGAGFFVWHAKKTADTSLNNANNAQSNTVTTPKKTVVSVPSKPVDTTKYLEVKEMGVKIPLTSGISDAYYNGYDNTGKIMTVNLRVHSLDSESDCKNGSASVAVLEEINKADFDPNQTGAGSIPKGGTTIGDKYYFVDLAQYVCAQNPKNQTLLDTVRTDFQNDSSKVVKL